MLGKGGGIDLARPQHIDPRIEVRATASKRSTSWLMCWPLARQSSSNSLYSSGDRGLRRATSIVVNKAASGVRRSWEMSAAACFSRECEFQHLQSVVEPIDNGLQFQRACASSNGNRKSLAETRLTASDSRRNGDRPRRTSKKPPTTVAAKVRRMIHNSLFRNEASAPWVSWRWCANSSR